MVGETFKLFKGEVYVSCIPEAKILPILVEAHVDAGTRRELVS